MDGLGRGQRPDAPFGAAYHRACQVAGGGGRPAAGQDEILERRQRIVEAIQKLLELRDAPGLDRLRAGDAQLAAQVEQIVLDLREATRHVGRNSRRREDHADGAVGLVDRAIRLDPDMILADAAAVAESRGAIVAREAISHGASGVQSKLKRTPMVYARPCVR
jgi:hypothetical protein